ncbi:hypothetical protein DPMN_056810 [Dreissena polymorpha]|uniref:Uncharacterized protein n=1 Tax=Dreissena polymorpha TaxID=45954 RepID=A0A9D4HRU9_DREPO|nr:hypothetical protein DPMN_056810 [Dreissena polymorpha]
MYVDADTRYCSLPTATQLTKDAHWVGNQRYTKVCQRQIHDKVSTDAVHGARRHAHDHDDDVTDGADAEGRADENAVDERQQEVGLYERRQIVPDLTHKRLVADSRK